MGVSGCAGRTRERLLPRPRSWALIVPAGRAETARTPYGMETESHGRGSGAHRVYALAAILVERPVRQRAAGPGLCLAGPLVLSACLCLGPGARLLADQRARLRPHAKRRRGDRVRKTPSLH